MTWEEILKAMKAEPTLVKEVVKFIITTDEGKEVLENHAKQYSEKAIGEKMSEIYNGLDSIVLETLGVTKPANKKTSEVIKEIAIELKELKEKKGSTNPEGDAKRVKELEAELDKVKKEDWPNKYNALAQETSKKIEDFTNEIQTLKNGNTETIVGGDLAIGLSGLKFNPLIPKTAIDALTGRAKDDVLKNAKIVDGKPVYYKADGTPYLNELFKPATAAEIFSAELKDVLEISGNSGGGSEGEKGKVITIKEGEKETKKVVLDASKFNTKLTFAQHAEEVLLANGVERNSKEWHDIEQTARAEYGVDAMERV